MPTWKINRVVYRLWHDKSAAGRIGYIGKDKYHPSRWNLLARRKQKGCRKLYNALFKYPLKVWNKEILARGFRSDAALSKAEIFFIKKFDSKNKGYNLTDGGEGTAGMKLSAAHKRKIAKAITGRKFSAESKAKMSLAQTGNTKGAGHKLSKAARKAISKRMQGNKFCVGRKHSEETKRKIGDGNRGKTYSAATRKRMSKARKEYYKRLRNGL